MAVNPWLASASAAACLVLMVHWVVGGGLAARPLLKSVDLQPVARFSVYSTWHQVTVMIAALAVALGLASVAPDLRELAIFAAVLAGCIAVWNLALVISQRQSLVAMPQWLLFGAISALATAGLR